jgi:hypothetical protein
VRNSSLLLSFALFFYEPILLAPLEKIRYGVEEQWAIPQYIMVEETNGHQASHCGHFGVSSVFGQTHMNNPPAAIADVFRSFS